ncbi:hypothetical protein LSUE1_G004414 [Lachnellula suecica]|uniref:DUF7702 domain-containing protein n=1 Tax=Lachnellula suecica TaxID=602035 RepID=A0A8T9CC88_9HELO|nr:hypothetical protein LSUE1_G004414 [Lachnellula suecica]
MSSASALSIATIIIYVLLLNPILYALYRHHRYGILAFLPLSSFCVLKIVASIIQLRAEATNSSMTNALLLNNIGLSPLLIGALGLLHESRTARNPLLRKKLEWFLVINFHGAVVAGLALVIAGVAGEEGSDPTAADSTLRKAGLLVVLACWFVLVAWTAVAYLRPQFDVNAPAYADGTKILFGVTAAIPFIGLRELYATLTTFLTSTAFGNSLAAKVVLSVVPEMIAVTIFAAIGISTLHIAQKIRTKF